MNKSLSSEVIQEELEGEVKVWGVSDGVTVLWVWARLLQKSRGGKRGEHGAGGLGQRLAMAAMPVLQLLDHSDLCVFWFQS